MRFILALLLFGLLYVSKMAIQRLLQAMVILIGGKNHHATYLYSLIFLPGVMVHELSHFFLAAATGVKTGEINLFPQPLDEENERVALGSVAVAKTDFIRGSLIGAAPIIFGTGVMYVLIRSMFDINQLLIWPPNLTWLQAGVIYLVWSLGNTIFMSREDMHAWPVLLTFGVIFIIAVIIGGYFLPIVSMMIPYLDHLANVLIYAFGAAFSLNVIVGIGLFLGVKFLERMKHKRVVYY